MKSAVEKDMHHVTVKVFENIIDEYGQKHTKYTEQTVSMFIRKYKQTVMDSPLYNDVQLIGLTKSTLSDNCNVIYDGKEYHVKFVIDSNSYTGEKHFQQVFMEIYGNN